VRTPAKYRLAEVFLAKTREYWKPGSGILMGGYRSVSGSVSPPELLVDFNGGVSYSLGV